MPIVRQIRPISAKAKKTDDDHAEIAQLEWLGGLYHDPDVGPFIPAEPDQVPGRGRPDTRAVDHLIGGWDPTTRQRTNGCGLHAVAEMAWRADPTQPITPTVNPGIDPGGGLLIDWLLANDAMTPHVLPGTYRVHLPDPGQQPPSDHRLVTCSLTLDTPREEGR